MSTTEKDSKRVCELGGETRHFSGAFRFSGIWQRWAATANEIGGITFAFIVKNFIEWKKELLPPTPPPPRGRGEPFVSPPFITSGKDTFRSQLFNDLNLSRGLSPYPTISSPLDCFLSDTPCRNIKRI